MEKKCGICERKLFPCNNSAAICEQNCFTYRLRDLQLQRAHREGRCNDLVTVGVQDLHVAFAAKRGNAGEGAHCLATLAAALLRLLAPLLVIAALMEIDARFFDGNKTRKNKKLKLDFSLRD